MGGSSELTGYFIQPVSQEYKCVWSQIGIHLHYGPTLKYPLVLSPFCLAVVHLQRTVVIFSTLRIAPSLKFICLPYFSAEVKLHNPSTTPAKAALNFHSWYYFLLLPVSHPTQPILWLCCPLLRVQRVSLEFGAFALMKPKKDPRADGR